MNTILRSLLLLGLGASQAHLSAQAPPGSRTEGPRRVEGWTGAATAALPVRPSFTAAARPTPADVAAMVVGGTFTAGASLVAGVLLGVEVEERWFACDFCDEYWAGGILGGLILPAATTPLVVHVANGSAGSLGTTMAASFAAAMTGVLVGVGARDLGAVLLVPPIVEVIGTVVAEYATSP